MTVDIFFGAVDEIVGVAIALSSVPIALKKESLAYLSDQRVIVD